MLADLPADQAADESEFLTRLGQFSLLTPAQRGSVLAARTEAVRGRLTHLHTMRKLAEEHGEVWGARVTDELIGRDKRELGWLASLASLSSLADDREADC